MGSTMTTEEERRQLSDRRKLGRRDGNDRRKDEDRRKNYSDSQGGEFRTGAIRRLSHERREDADRRFAIIRRRGVEHQGLDA